MEEVPWPLGDRTIIGQGPASRSRLALLRRLNASRPPPTPPLPMPPSSLRGSPVPPMAVGAAAAASPQAAAAAASVAVAEPARQQQEQEQESGTPTGLVLGAGTPSWDGVLPLFVVLEAEGSTVRSFVCVSGAGRKLLCQLDRGDAHARLPYRI